MKRRSLAMLIVAMALGACAAAPPSGPGVVATAGKHKSVAAFRQDDTDCRQVAAARVDAAAETTAAPQQRYDASYAQCMCAKGDRVAQGLAAYPLVATSLLPTISASGGGHR